MARVHTERGNDDNLLIVTYSHWTVMLTHYHRMLQSSIY